jgi:hypothetical protein
LTKGLGEEQKTRIIFKPLALFKVKFGKHLWHYFLTQATEMKQRHTRVVFTCLLFVFLQISSLFAFSQKTVIVDSSNPHVYTVIAGEEYRSSPWHKWLWGEDYRKEWSTPVKIRVLNMDSAYGGLTPFKEGGGRQTKTIHVKDAQGKRYVLRSVNKTYTKALPEIYRGTIIEDLANDQIATNHPYAALAIPQLAEAANVYHTNPKYYVIPNTNRLGQFRDTFANMLVLMEEHPDDTQADVESFGRPEDIVSTEKMYEKMAEENHFLMDQHKYVMTRLFDMFVGDWGRHPDNWRWAKFDSGSYKIYRPVPKDRDQAWAKFEGLLLSLAVRFAGLEQLQSFDDKIKNVAWYNYTANELDRRFTNQLTKQDWIDSAKALQQYATDAVIENAVRQMPPEIFSESGEEIIRKLKLRRDKMVKYATDYYDFLAKEVDIPGSIQKEIFTVQRLDDHHSSVAVYPVDKHGKTNHDPTFSRTFSDKETRELRLYGIGGNDVFYVEGNADNAIIIRIVGGPGNDSVINESAKINYYDNPGNYVSGRVKKYLSTDSSVNAYNYQRRELDKKAMVIMPNYTNERSVFIDVGYKAKRYGWRKEPYASKQSILVNYSVFNHSFGGDYKAFYNEAIGKWSILIDASFDQIVKNYFFGLGNETIYDKNISYYKLHTRKLRYSMGLNRIFAKYNSFTVSGFFEGIKLKKETDHLPLENLYPNDGTVFGNKAFVGALASYLYYNVNDEVVPTKGFGFSLNASHTKNLSQTDKWFNRYWTTLGFYLPVSSEFSIASRNGLSTLSGRPEFYQYNWIGGGSNLRGFHRERFYGKTAFYNNNELRWIPNVRSYFFNGKIGLIGFVDQGRVWMPKEDSNKWHVGYGGGLLVSPFNKMTATLYYGMSEDDHVIHIRLGRFF